ncbi:phage major capsid protein [Burkholderia thailandensis]|uniref:phage major capsid protein n=1 Tax=Burkholderia thailandensis TaxID=57975 RepID=UPI000CB515FC|nr:phage major capsid protein [Burkholderia thailandensis]MCS6490767.1 phage major capsid protein [Burkholderia thailandensis]MCS6518143.1 phage major capsid protein [Burkholderia thailandensis]PJO72424.1 phage major capsid protein [Burkholderia thailandensis]
MKLHEIREAKATKVATMRALLTKAETEKRSLNADEQATFNTLRGEIEALEADEQRAQFMTDLERRMMGDPVTANDFANVERRVVLLDVIRAGMEGRALDGAAAEFARETERRTGRKAQGFYVPMAAFDTRPVEQRDAQTTTTAAGIVPNDFRADQFIGPLRNALVMRSLGARVLTGLRGDVEIPKYKTGMTAGWVSENESLQRSGMGFDKPVTLRPRHVGALTELSRQLIQQSSPDINGLVRDDLSAVMGEALDTALLSGDGVKQPLGLLNMAGIQTASLAKPTWDGVLRVIEKLDLVNVNGGRWLSNPSVKRVLSATEKAANTGIYLTDGATMAGYSLVTTNQVPNKAGDTPTGRLIFGDFSQLILGIWSEVDILVNPYAESAYEKGNVLVRAMMTCDQAIRHPQAFVSVDDVAIA